MKTQLVGRTCLSGLADLLVDFALELHLVIHHRLLCNADLLEEQVLLGYRLGGLAFHLVSIALKLHSVNQRRL